MDTKINKIHAATNELIITFQTEELQEHLNKAYLDAMPHINIKGFRKGKVPMAMVKKLYGKEIEMETLEKLANDTFKQMVNDKKIKPIGMPDITGLDKKDDIAVITIRFDIIPELELADYKSLTVDEPNHPVTDEEVEKELQEILKYEAKPEPRDEVTDYMDVVDVKISVLDEATGLPMIGEKVEESPIFLGNDKIPEGIKLLCIGKKVGDTFNYRPKEGENQMPNQTFRFEVTKINKLIPPELTDEFIQVYTNNKFQNVEDFRADLGFKMQEEWTRQGRNAMEEQIIEQICKANEFELPESVVTNVMFEMAEDLKKKYEKNKSVQAMKTEQIAQNMRPQAEATVRWELLKKRIIEIEKIEVEDYDIDEFIEPLAQQFQMEKEEIKKIYESNDDLKNQILHKKVMDFLLDFTTTNEVSFEEYHAKHHEHEHHHHHDHDHDHDHEHHHHDHDHEEEN